VIKPVEDLSIIFYLFFSVPVSIIAAVRKAEEERALSREKSGILRKAARLLNIVGPGLFLIGCNIGLIAVTSRDISAARQDFSDTRLGMQPAQGDTVQVNPPYFAWGPREGKTRYQVELSRSADFGDEVKSFPETGYCIYRPQRTLAAGRWYWRVKALETGSASRLYSFWIPNETVEFPAPDFEVMLDHVPEEHPRLLMRPGELPGLRSAMQGALQEDWIYLTKRAEEAFDLPLETPDHEPEPWEDAARAEHWRKNFTIARNTVYAGEVLAFCYMLSGEQQYLDGARRILHHILSWDPAGPTSNKANDECAMPILQYLPRMYDWMYPALSEKERQAVVANILIRGREARERLEEFQYNSFGSHNHRLFHQLAEAGIACYTEIPEAREWIRYALNIYHAWYPMWGDIDGGWSAGLSYYSGYTLMLTSWIDAAETALNLDSGAHPYVGKAGNFAMYLGPGGIFTQGFGDLAELVAASGMRPMIETLALSLRRPEWLYLASKIEPSGRAGWFQVAPGRSRPQLFIRKSRDGIMAPEAPKVLPLSKIFRRSGMAVMNSDLVDGTNNVQVQFRSSPLGTVSHMLADQNSFLISAYGKRLAIQAGFRPWMGSEFWTKFYSSSVSKNTILVDGEAQMNRSLEAVGRITRHVFGKRIDMVEGHAAQAYGDRLKRFVRKVIFIKPDIVVVIDSLEAPKMSAYTWQLHALNEISTVGPDYFSTTCEGVTLAGRIIMPGEMTLRVTHGWPLEPEMNPRNIPEQWHLRAESAPARELMIAVVMKISRADKTGTQFEAEYSAVVPGGEFRITDNGRSIKITNPGGNPSVELNARAFSEKLVLQPVN
jgi:Domain of unknown function (DUF4962)/Heparinase II/III-like protein